MTDNARQHETTAPEASSKGQRFERVAYWEIVWQQLRKNRIAILGLWSILALVLLAVFAPVMALNKPFFLTIDGQTQWPWFVSLFDRLFFENSIDIFFNLALLAMPVYVGLFLASRAFLGNRFRYEWPKALFAIGGLHFLLVLGVLRYSCWLLYGIAFLIVLALAGQRIREVWPKMLGALAGIHLLNAYGVAAAGFDMIVLFAVLVVLGLVARQWPLIAVGVGASFLLVVGSLNYSLPYKDHVELIARAESQGKSVSYLFPPIRHSYREYDMTRRNPAAPSWLGKVKTGNFYSPFFWWRHRNNLLGSDKTGRDVLTRMLYGTRVSLTIGVVAVSMYVTIGVILGATAGYFGGRIDMVISRIIEVMLCFPTFFLILTLTALIDRPSIFHIMALIGVTRWTGVARLVRGEFLKLKNLDYVQAAIALGLGRARIIFGHVLPNALAPVLVAATFGVAAAILTESSLAFLGLGDPTAPSWGQTLSVGRETNKLWLILTPGVAIFFVVSVFNLVGEGLRDALDPKLRQ